MSNYARIVLNNRSLLHAVALLAIAFAWSNQAGRLSLRAQENNRPAEEAGPSAVMPAPAAEPAGPPPAQQPKDTGINLLQLANDGGIFMYPLYLMSILAVAVAVERAIGLRRDKVCPQALTAAIGQLGQTKGGFDPRRAYRICQEHPSSTSNVIRSMLLKVGRPHSEVEHAVKEASEREANRLYANVRWLNLAAAIAPLVGLLGTVQGMIMAFHMTTTLPPNANKATALAGGIYTALVTTFAGLCIAIPAAIASHYYEARIQSLFHDIDELLFNLLPQIERFEGRVRFSRPAGDGESVGEVDDIPAAPPVQAPQPPSAPTPRAPAAAPK